jgi:hypothetical protein
MKLNVEFVLAKSQLKNDRAGSCRASPTRRTDASLNRADSQLNPPPTRASASLILSLRSSHRLSFLTAPHQAGSPHCRIMNRHNDEVAPAPASPDQDDAPSATAFGTLRVRVRHRPNQSLCHTQVTIEIDGVPYSARWGVQEFEVPDGEHAVAVSFRYCRGARGRAERTIVVAPGATVELDYESPLFMFWTRGRLSMDELRSSSQATDDPHDDFHTSDFRHQKQGRLRRLQSRGENPMVPGSAGPSHSLEMRCSAVGSAPTVH